MQTEVVRRSNLSDERLLYTRGGIVDNRREHPRVDVTTAAVVLARHNTGVAFTIESISAGGARLVGPLTLDVGERVQVLFELAGTPIDVEGEVVRAERHDMMNDRVAIAFKNVSETTRSIIHQIVVTSLDLEHGRGHP